MELIRAKFIAIVDDNVYKGIKKYIKNFIRFWYVLCTIYICGLKMRPADVESTCFIMWVVEGKGW